MKTQTPLKSPGLFTQKTEPMAGFESGADSGHCLLQSAQTPPNPPTHLEERPFLWVKAGLTQAWVTA